MPLLVGVVVLLAAIFAASVSAAGELAERQTSRYIVVLEDSVDHPRTVARAQVEQRDGHVGYVYRHALKGYSAELPKGAVEGLRNDPRVKYVTPDHRLQPFAQSTPTGIDRVFATANKGLDIDEEDDSRVDVDVAVIDSGIDYEHPDLNVVARTDCSTKEGEAFECVDESGTDTFGHGTHVAGTIGAIDNGAGVVGVAPGARLWAVKIHIAFPVALFESSTVAGVDWVAAHSGEIEVANMSIGCTTGFVANCSSLPALATAISTAVDEGVVFAVAAGNENVDAKNTYPASHPDVITVSAIEDLDGSVGEGKDPRASFSNFGSTIEVAAPGVSIFSTWPEGKYLNANGTSMASPHVAGAAAILASQSNPETQEDVEAIRATILEEGNFSWEDTSGDGIKEPLLDVSNEEVFTPSVVEEEVEVPSAATEAATGVTVSGAKLHGAVNPNGAKTTYQFEYGTTTSYGSKAPGSPEEVGSGTSSVEVSETIGGLEPNTNYHFRVVATNAAGTVYGEDETLKTAEAVAPSATTEAATGVSSSGAKIRGSVNPNGTATSYQFEYGLTASYGSKEPASPEGIGSGSSGVEVSETIGGLEPVTTYHFRVVATNTAGTTYGEDKTFETPEAPEGPEWVIQPTPNPAEANESRLTDVSCLSKEMCMAVGTFAGTESSGAVAEAWDGAEWANATPPAGVELNDVKCMATITSDGCVLAANKEGQVSPRSWSPASGWFTLATESVPGASSSTLNGVECGIIEEVELGECWIVGSYMASSKKRTLAMRFDLGKGEWVVVKTPNAGEWDSELNAVSCNATGSCTAVGSYFEPEFGEEQPFAMHWDGKEWSTQEVPTISEGEGFNTYLSDVSCTGESVPASACIAVGGKEVGTIVTAVGMSWDGEEWSLATPAQPGEEEQEFSLRGVSCVSETECYAAGDFSGQALIETWNGTEWGVVPSLPSPEGALTSELEGVSCSSTSECVAVGSAFDGEETTETLAMHLE